MLFDTHAHLDIEPLSVDLVSKAMKEDNLAAIVFVGVDEKSSLAAIDASKTNKNIFPTVGFHPEFANDWNESRKKEIKKIAKNPSLIAFGEIGLDYHYDGYDKEKQKKLLWDCIEIAHSNNLPIILHVRDAGKDAIEIVKSAKSKGLIVGGVAHCFSGTLEEMKEFVSLGFYISFAGNFTYKKYNREIAKQVPYDKLLVETDAPYLTPEPMRGQANHPKNVKLTVEKLAETLNLDSNEIQKILKANTLNCFKKIKL